MGSTRVWQEIGRGVELPYNLPYLLIYRRAWDYYFQKKKNIRRSLKIDGRIIVNITIFTGVDF